MIKLETVYKIYVGNNGQWTLELSGQTMSFVDRCAALEWALDKLIKELGKDAFVWPDIADGCTWNACMKGNDHTNRFSTREGALEWVLGLVAEYVLNKRNKKK